MFERIKIEIGNTGHITNCYILYNSDKEAIVIDPADKAELIIDRIEKLELNLKYILLTHAHADHTFALNEIIDKYNVKVIANEHEKELITGNIPDHAYVFGRNTQPHNLNNFIFLKDNDIIPFNNISIQMLYTPGHTAGSVCYYLKDENIMFTGDTLFCDCFGRCDLESGSIESMIHSLIRLYKNYNTAKIYPGHDDVGIRIEDTYDKINNYLKFHEYVNLDDILN